MKRLLTIMLCGVMITATMPISSFAKADTDRASTAAMDVVPAAEVPVGSQVEPTDKALESAILAVKEKITIPKEYSEFNYYFNNSNNYSESFWSLSWSNPITNAYIQINCDVNNHITYFNKYDYNQKRSGLAKYLKSELKDTADAFILQIAPEIAAKVEYLSADYEGIYSGDYVYRYQRSYAGIAFPDNTVSVSVNSNTGEVTGASIQWLYDVRVPSGKVKVSVEDAVKLIKENMKMKLVYRSDYYGIYDRNGNYQKKAYLVYEPTLNYISIDANTKEVYLSRSEWVVTNSFTSKEVAATAEADAGGVYGSRTLTEEEIKKIEELQKLISKSEAIEKITKNKYLYIDKNLNSYSATLNKREDGSKKTSYVWNISFNDPREIDYEKDLDYYRGYAYATVDAETGKILSYYSSVKNSYDYKNQKWLPVEVPYDKEQGKAILEKFLTSQMKEYYSNSVFSSDNNGYVVYYKDNVPVYGGYSYEYSRVNEGVEYPYNGVYGAVDGVTGKIYSVGTNWDNNVVFESTKGVMSAEKAMDYYLSKEGFGLKYEINVINKFDSQYGEGEEYYDYTKAYSVEREVRLVYRPDVNPSYISPFTGEQLDYQGKVYTVTMPYAYKDIENTQKDRNILLLADMNIGFEGENFLPEQAITVSEMNELLQKVGYYYSSSTISEASMNKPLTREDLAKLFVTTLGFEKIASLPGIYKTGFADESSITPEYLGAVALAKGFGLMKADANNLFNPKSSITRREAIDYIMEFIGVRNNDLMNY